MIIRSRGNSHTAKLHEFRESTWHSKRCPPQDTGLNNSATFAPPLCGKHQVQYNACCSEDADKKRRGMEQDHTITESPQYQYPTPPIPATITQMSRYAMLRAAGNCLTSAIRALTEGKHEWPATDSCTHPTLLHSHCFKQHPSRHSNVTTMYYTSPCNCQKLSPCSLAQIPQIPAPLNQHYS
jgi:hypothetical protein